LGVSTNDIIPVCSLNIILYCLLLPKSFKMLLYWCVSAESEVGRSLATDGVFLYTTNACGKGVAKFGTGLRGSLR